MQVWPVPVLAEVANDIFLIEFKPGYNKKAGTVRRKRGQDQKKYGCLAKHFAKL